MSEKLSYEELKRRLDECPRTGERFRHYKSGDFYRVVGSAIAESTQAPLVLYRTAVGIDAPIFARPLSEWNETVAHNGADVRRFEPAEPGSLTDAMRALWEAGGKDWGNIDDPEAFLREVAGE